MGEYIVTKKAAGWVTDIGEFGTNKILVFENSELTKCQWNIVDDLHESERYEYILSILERTDNDN